MELRHLRVFLVLADELHFGRASQRLHVAQSAVSQTLKALEDDVGTRLIDRTRRRCALTAAGTRFAESARRAVDEVERGSMEARRAANGDVGRLRLRFTTTSGLTFLPRALAKFRAAHPHVVMEISAGGSSEQLTALGDGSCDIGFMTLRNDVGALASTPVVKSPLSVLVSRRHPLARKPRAPFSSLAGEPMVVLREASEPSVTLRFRRRCAENGFEPNVIVEVEQIDVMLAFVAAGVGISLGPQFLENLAKGVRAVPVTPHIPVGISAVWDDATLSPAGHRFLEVMSAVRSPRT